MREFYLFFSFFFERYKYNFVKLYIKGLKEYRYFQFDNKIFVRTEKATSLNAFSTAARYAFCSNFRFYAVTEEYLAGNSRAGSIDDDDDAYLGDEYEGKDGYEDSSSNSDFQPKVRYTFTFLYFSSSQQRKRINFPSTRWLLLKISFRIRPCALSFLIRPSFIQLMHLASLLESKYRCSDGICGRKIGEGTIIA